ncbi:activator-dependent family glycosyltransferase [Amycolatopsis anabasis]|uniref:activator-dependent family glycosyltransferase n=1 Tax=Amycolatopsis anabasis TaxID=1840409 RepID=UPI00131ADC18|nr:activator-dependent family glycosyltransferase [Amycolatopsis anabasis]
MRVLFTAYAEKTHFLSMVPLAWALRTAGHEVRVASQPALVDVITQAGLTAVPVGADHTVARVTQRLLNKRFAERFPDIYDKVRWGRVPPYDLPDDPARITGDYLESGYTEIVAGYRMVNEPMIDDVVAFARHWEPDLVIWEPATHAGAIAAKAVGAAHARLLWSLDFFGRMREQFLRYREQAPGRPDALADWLGEQGAKYGVEFTEDLTTGQFTVDQFPDSLRMDAGLHYVPMRYVPYPGRAVVPKWLWERPERPRVCLTLGISSTERFGGYSIGVAEILDALSDLDIEVVATVAESEQAKLGKTPDNARIVSFVPLPALVPTCSAVIHHAGFGTLCTNLLNGVPQLTTPEQEDAVVSARRVAEQGAAVSIHATEVTGSQVREHLVRLLSDFDDSAYRRNAERLRDEMLAMPVPNAIVGDLEQLTGKYAARR